VLGIDFGTARTRAVQWDAQDDLAAAIAAMPSIALFQGNGFLVGELAKAENPQSSGVFVRGLKRMMERKPDDLVARVVAARSGVSLHLSDAQLVLCTSANSSAGVDGCVAAILHQAANAAWRAGPSNMRPAVMAIPEWFGTTQEAALREAARRVGIYVLRFIGDGCAAGIWAAREDPSERTIAFVNASAGGTATTLVSIDPQAVCLSSAASNRHWGGDDVLASLVERLLTQLPSGASEQLGVREILRRALEAQLPELSSRGSTDFTVSLGGSAAPTVLTASIREPEVRDALEGLLRAVDETCAEALDQADIDAAQIDEVVALGGMSLFGAVRDRIAAALHKPPAIEARFEHSVVLGCAYEAAILTERADGPLVLDGRSTGGITLVQ